MVPGHATPEQTASYARRGSASAQNYNTFLGLALSNVGVGTYLGDADAGTDTLVKDAVISSVNGGINVIDTAINYRRQKAERSVGAAVRELADDRTPRECLFISTKNGYVTDDADTGEDFWEYVRRSLVGRGVIKSGDISSGYHCMTVPYLADQLERSLSNLDVECIDLLYLHNAAEGQLQDITRERFFERLRDAFEFYEKKRSDGSIRYYGLATWECLRTGRDNPLHISLEDVLRTAKGAGGPDHGFRFIQLPYNMYMDQALTQKNQPHAGGLGTILDVALSSGIGVFTSVPLMQGRLLAPGVMPEFGDASPAVRALQFIRSTPGVLAPLVGHKLAEHVGENMRVMKTPPMSEDEFRGIVASLTGG